MIELIRKSKEGNHTTIKNSLIISLLLTILISTGCSKTNTVTQKNGKKTEQVGIKPIQEKYLNPELHGDDYITGNEIIPEE